MAQQTKPPLPYAGITQTGSKGRLFISQLSLPQWKI